VTPTPSTAPRPDASQPRSMNFAHRVGLWSARHRKKAIFGWLAFVILSFAIGTFAVTQQQIVYETSQPGESGRMEKILYEEFKPHAAARRPASSEERSPLVADQLDLLLVLLRGDAWRG
jgi:hypothetical protein